MHVHFREPLSESSEIGTSNFSGVKKQEILTVWPLIYESITLGLRKRLIEENYNKDLEKQRDLRDCLGLVAVTQLWHMAQWVSRAPSHHTLPAFLNLNGTFISSCVSFEIRVSCCDSQHVIMNLQVAITVLSQNSNQFCCFWAYQIISRILGPPKTSLDFEFSKNKTLASEKQQINWDHLVRLFR